MKQDIKFDDYDLPDLQYDFTFSNNTSTSVQQGTYTEEFKQVTTSTTTSKPSRTIKFQVEANSINEYMKLPEVKLSANQEKKLGDFLKKVEKEVFNALNESEQLKLIHTYEPSLSQTRKEVTELYRLKNLKLMDNTLEIIDIQWNNNGLLIAAGYGQLEHSGSCDHKGCIAVWDIGRRDFQADNPHKNIETQGCVMCLSFHPTKPNIIAIGFFTGIISIYDLTRPEPDIVSSEVDEYFHRESITQLTWLEQTSNLNYYFLLSLGSDGKILLWNAQEPYNNCLRFPNKGFLMLRKKENQIESVGATCISKCSEDNFIIGSEGGSVLRGLISQPTYEKKNLLDSPQFLWLDDAQNLMSNINQKFLPDVKSQVEDYCKRRSIREIQVKQIIASKPELRKIYINPISFAYEGHYGTVFSVSSSPFLRNLFATCSMDGQIRLYDTLTARSLITYEYLNQYIISLQFSPARPNVFAACSTTGILYLFDLCKDRKREVQKIFPQQMGSHSSATNIRFNQRQQDLLMVSFSGQQVIVYQLSDQFVKFQKDEDQNLNDLIEDMK